MNKKALKYVLIVSGMVLLLGLGIWGYKYIKNRNDDKKTNENESELKELANLTSYGAGTAGGYALNYYYNGPIDMGKNCLIGKNNVSYSCYKYNFYLTIYVNDSIKLKSSWMYYSFEGYSSANNFVKTNNMSKKLSTGVVNSKFLVISLSNVIYCYSNSQIVCDSSYDSKTVAYYPYTKVFDATTGDMIFAVPTNNNEKIKITDTFDGVSGSSFANNMYLKSTAAIYYLKSNYTLTDGNNVEVHKVVFDDSYSNKYNDTIIAYTTGTITNS